MSVSQAPCSSLHETPVIWGQEVTKGAVIRFSYYTRERVDRLATVWQYSRQLAGLGRARTSLSRAADAAVQIKTKSREEYNRISVLSDTLQYEMDNA